MISCLLKIKKNVLSCLIKIKKYQLKSYLRTNLNFMLKTVLFDMDGVIVDTEPLHQRAYMHMFHKVGVRVSKEQFNVLQGNQRWLYANNFAIIII